MSVEVTFETHSTSVDNEAGIASGWRNPVLSALGRKQAAELGERRRDDGIQAVFCSDLLRARETAEIAFGGRMPIRPDDRLREYDYGTMTGAAPALIHAEIPGRVETPFPEGESLRDVADRVRSFLDDLKLTWDGKRVVAIGHSATKLSLDHLLGGMPLAEAAAQPFVWQPGWRYTLDG